MSSQFLAGLKKERSDSTTTEQSRDCFFYLVDRCKYVKCDLEHRNVDLSKAVLPAWQKMAAQIIYDERRRVRNLEAEINESNTRNRKLYRDIEDLEENRRLQNTAYDGVKETLDSKTNECDQLRGQYNAQIQLLNESATKIHELERAIQMLKDEKSYRDTFLNYNSSLHHYSQPQSYPQSYPYYGGYYLNPPTTSNPGLFYYTPPLPSADQAAQTQTTQTPIPTAQTQTTQAPSIQNLQYQSSATSSLNSPPLKFSPITPQSTYAPQQTLYSPDLRYKPY
jgi:hypothetical protein